MTFSIIKEPIIPVMMLDGSMAKLSLRDTILRAHEVKNIRVNPTPKEYAVLRFLIAFVGDMLQLKDEDARADLFEQKHFDQKTFDDYIALCNQDGEHFDLFDPIHPFLQAAIDRRSLSQQETKRIKSVANLDLTYPSGNNNIFIDHRIEANCTMKPDKALIEMISISLNALNAQRGGYNGGVCGIGTVFHWVEMNNLFETIVINLLSKSEIAPFDYGEGDVPWRNADPIGNEKKYSKASYLGAMTWQARKIKLFASDDELIREIYFAPGKMPLDTKIWQDPAVAYYSSGKAMVAKEGKALWRDLSALLIHKEAKNGSDTDKHIRPKAIVQAEKLIDSLSDGKNKNVLNIRQFGLVVGSMSAICLEYNEDELSLPNILLRDVNASSIVCDEIRQIEILIGSISKAVRNTVYESCDPKKFNADGNYIVSCLTTDYLTMARTFMFDACIPDLCKSVIKDNDYYKNHYKMFFDGLRAICRKMIKESPVLNGAREKDIENKIKIKNNILGDITKGENACLKKFEPESDKKDETK